MGTFDHIHIYAADVTQTIGFYTDVFGAEEIGVLPNRSGGHNHLFIMGGQFLAVSAFPAGMSPHPPAKPQSGALDVGFGIAHFGFNVEDLDDTLGRAMRWGCEVHGEPATSGPLRFVYFTAPDGVVVELTQYVLPGKLRLAGAAMRGLNGGIHAIKRWVGRTMLAAAVRKS